MKKYAILSGFIPWIIFSAFVGNSVNSIIHASILALSFIIIIEYKQLKKYFIFPILSSIYFILSIVNAYFELIPQLNNSQIVISNSMIALIIWISIIIKRPFTIQYAKEQVDKKYWSSPLFKKSNWYLAIAWAIILSIAAIPSMIIPQEIYIKSWFWNYGFSIILIFFGIYLNTKIPNLIISRNFWETIRNLPPLDSPYLKNGFKPVLDEVNLDNLSIIGTIPKSLSGRYLRNGPNPYFTPYTYTYPIDGDGMIHELSFHNGSVKYKNMFVKTDALLCEMKAGKPLFGGIKLPIPTDPNYNKTNEYFKNGASINILPWQGKLLALYESELAYILDNNLNTIGKWQPNGVKSKVNAHYRTDYKTKQTYMCTYNNDDDNFLTIYEFNEKQELTKTTPINKSRATMIHDFVITENYIIIFDCPAIFNTTPDLSNAEEQFFNFYPEEDVKILLISRSNYSITTIENIPSFFVYHFVNAYENNNEIMIDFILHKTLNLNPNTSKNSEGPKLYRATIELNNNNYSHTCLINNIIVEFPIYNQFYTANSHQFIYLACKNENAIGNLNNLIKFDCKNNSYTITKFDDNIEVGEPVFIYEPAALSEDNAYIGCYLYDKVSDTSDFILLDAQNINHEIARIKLPRRVPHGLHGIWQSYALNNQ